MAKLFIEQINLFNYLGKLEGYKSNIPFRRAAEYLETLVNAGLKPDFVWLNPFFLSPWSDHGYDVENYCGVHPAFGTMEDFHYFMNTANRLGVKVILDLVINHTSAQHPWTRTNPEFYCTSKSDKPGWKSIYDGNSPWKKSDEEADTFRCHLFHPDPEKGQIDVSYFPNGPQGEINHALVREFQNIVKFWVDRGANGFRLDAAQCIGKDINAETFDLMDTLRPERMKMVCEVINKIFAGHPDMFLVPEIFDPNGEMTKYYLENSHSKAIFDIMVKQALKEGGMTNFAMKSLTDTVNKGGIEVFLTAAAEADKRGAIHSTQSHDSPTPTSFLRLTAEQSIRLLLGKNPFTNEQVFDPWAICMYNGQETGVTDPTKEQMSNEKMLSLDMQSEKAWNEAKEKNPSMTKEERERTLDEIRATSRSNSRFPLPLKQRIEEQAKDPNSTLNYAVKAINEWKNAG